MNLLVGDAAEKRLTMKLGGWFPTLAKGVEVEIVCQQISQFSHTQAHKMAPLKLQRGVKQLITWLTVVSSDVGFDCVKNEKSQLLNDIFAKFVFLARAVGQD